MDGFENKIKVSNQTRKIEGEYNTLKGRRESFLSRARDFSSFTLPHLLPDTLTHGGDLGGGANQYGWDNIGAAATNHLSNKITNTLFPHQYEFFTLEFDTKGEKALAEAGIEKTELNSAILQAVREAKAMEKKVEGRVAMYAASEHLIVAGNVLIWEVMGKLQAVPLDRYVVKRDKGGNVQTVIVEESKDINSFPKEMQGVLKAAKIASPNKSKGVDGKEDKSLKSFTRYKRDGDNYIIDQEVEGISVDTPKTVAIEKTACWPLRFKSNYGEDYGRGLVENHAGDFFVIAFLSEAIVKGMALMSDVKYLVKPGSMIDLDHFIKSPTGEILYGHKDDITIIQLEKYADFTPISEVLNEYKRRIGQAFLMNSAVRRDAERVTTVELRMDAAEIEGAFGGYYTNMDVSLQTPYAKWLLHKVDFDYDTANIEPVIKTGMDALGRLGDLDKLYQFSEVMSLPNNWPVSAQQAIVWPTYMSDAAASLNMKTDWIKTPEQLAADAEAERKAAQEDEALKAAAGGMSKAIPDMIK